MALSPEYVWILICIPFIAFLYASVGHGGASGYIALMYLFSFSDTTIKPIALTMNLFVAGIAFYHYWKSGYFKFNLFIYFALGSIPLSFLGGYLQVSPLIYNSILAVFLVFSIIKLAGGEKGQMTNQHFNAFIAVAVGAGIGFSSGLIGIGGGIILTPILVLFNWASIKEAAAISALFIWVNSFAGLSGQLLQGVEIPELAWPMIGAAILGGFLGSYLGANKVKQSIVKGLLITVLSIACIKLLFSIWQMM